MTTKTAMGFVAFFLAMACLSMAQGADSTATGVLTMNPEATFAQGGDETKTIKLSFARVQATKDPFDKKKDEFRIVLSDQPVTDATMKEANGVTKLVQTGKLQAVEFFLAADGKPSWGTLLYKTLSLSLNEQSFKFERKVFDGKTVAGKLSMDVRNIVSGKPKYSCAVTFSAPVLR